MTQDGLSLIIVEYENEFILAVHTGDTKIRCSLTVPKQCGKRDISLALRNLAKMVENREDWR